MGWLKIEGRSKLLKHVYRALITIPMIRSANKCIAVSEREVKDYISHGVNPINIEFIPNGIEASPFLSNDNGVAFRKKYSTSANWKTTVENFQECYHCAPSHQSYSAVHEKDFVKIPQKNKENINFLEIDLIIKKQNELISFIRSKI